MRKSITRTFLGAIAIASAALFSTPVTAQQQVYTTCVLVQEGMRFDVYNGKGKKIDEHLSDLYPENNIYVVADVKPGPTGRVLLAAASESRSPHRKNGRLLGYVDREYLSLLDRQYCDQVPVTSIFWDQ